MMISMKDAKNLKKRLSHFVRLWKNQRTNRLESLLKGSKSWKPREIKLSKLSLAFKPNSTVRCKRLKPKVRI